MVKVHKNDIPPPKTYPPTKPPVTPPVVVTLPNTTTTTNSMATPSATPAKQLCTFDAANCNDPTCILRHKQPRNPTPRTAPNATANTLCPRDTDGCYDTSCAFYHVDTPNIKCKHGQACRNHTPTLSTCKLWHPILTRPAKSIPGIKPNPPKTTAPAILDPIDWANKHGAQGWGTLGNDFIPASNLKVSTTSITSTITPQPNIVSSLEGQQTLTHYVSRKRRRRHNTSPAQSRLTLLRLLCRNITNIGVHVLHDCHVSEEEMIVLTLGLNFCPPPRKSKTLLLTEAVDKFTRQVRIRKHFALLQLDDDSKTSYSIEQLLHLRVNKSLTIDEAKLQFEPSITHSPIESYLTHIRHTLCPITPENTSTSKPSRTWVAYYQVVQQLGKRTDIIIKPSDKNLGVTVMNRGWYIEQALLQLNNDSVYIPITSNPNPTSIIDELKLIIDTQQWLTKKTATKLLKDLIIDHTLNRNRLPRIYFLPKLHKIPTGLRPICASQGWITYWSSVYIHLSVFPLLKLIPTYITNSAQLVLMLDKIKPPPHFQFLEADVDQLYPSINIEEGLHALKSFLITARMHHTQISLLIKLTKWVLVNNYVTFGELTYLQISGTAMGTPCAVIFACIFVHTIEREALDIFTSTRFSMSCIFLFVRFLDDIIAIISDYDSGIEVMRLLSSRRKSIHFTFKIRNSEAQFLDLTLYKRTHRHIHYLESKAYSKPLNKFLFLPPNSCHPKHIFKGWAVGYGRRLRGSCTVDSDYTQVMDDFGGRTTARGYSENFAQEVRSSIPNRATVVESIRRGKTQQSPFIGVPFVITYSPEIRDALPAIKQALSLTEVANLDPHFPQIFGCRTTPLLTLKRNQIALCQNLVSQRYGLTVRRSRISRGSNHNDGWRTFCRITL